MIAFLEPLRAIPVFAWRAAYRRWAEFCLGDVGDYASRDDWAAAERTVRRILERISALTFFPSMGRAGNTEGTREPVVPGTPHIVIYRTADRVEVLRIRHGAQRWPGVFRSVHRENRRLPVLTPIVMP